MTHQNIGCLSVVFSDNNENPEAPLPRETIPLEQDLEQLETQLREVNANQEQLNKNFLELTEVPCLLRIYRQCSTDNRTFFAR